MSNSYYNHTTYPTPNSPGSSAQLRAELENITAGFALLPTLAANGYKVAMINSAGTAMMASSALQSLAITSSTINSTPIGATTAAAGTFTSLTVTGTASLGSTTVITGGTINGTPIGGSTPSTGAFTTVSASSGFTGALAGNVTGNLTGNVTGNVSGNLTGNVVSSGTSTFAAITMSGAIAMGTSKITGLGNPTLAQDAATKTYVDTADALKLNLTGGTMSGAIAMGTSKITGVGDPTAAQDATTKTYVDTGLALKLNLTGGTMSGAIAMGTSKITGVGDPTAAQDVATKYYVDNLSQGLDAKASCRVATTANITLSGTQTIDGVAVVAGDRVLVKDQTTTANNGIYLCAASTWTRTTDADTWTELPAAFVFVEVGSLNANNGYVCTVAPGGTLGTTAITWVQFSGAGQITAGAGLTKSGNTLDVGTASSSRIVVNADNIDLATTAVTAGTYQSMTVDAYGRVTAGTNPTTIAGYNISNAYTTTQVDSALTLKLSLTGGTMSGAIAMGTSKITGLGDPTVAQDAATKTYVDTGLALKLNLTGGTMSGAIAMGASKITGLADPTAAQDATTKTYVDGILGSATAASTSAAAAALSATNASNSATSSATSATASATSAASSLSSLNTFKGQYYGALSTDPTLDPLGNAMTSGDLYFNTTIGYMKVYDGVAWAIAYLPAASYLALTGGTVTGPTAISMSSSSDALRITQTGAGNALLVEDSSNPDSTPFAIDASGIHIQGHTASINFINPANGSMSTVLKATVGTGSGILHDAQAIYATANPTVSAPYKIFARSNTTTIGSHAIASNGDLIGGNSWQASDGTNFVEAAKITAFVDGVPGTSDMPGRLVFSTTADGASSPTERMRIGNDGGVGIGTSAAVSSVGVNINKTITGATTSYGMRSIGQVQSDVTSNARYFATGPSTQATTFTLGSISHFYAEQGTFGAGSTITNQYGFFAESSLASATNNYGFYGNIASGTGRYNLYMNGTADNYMAGALGVGAVPIAGRTLNVGKSITGNVNGIGVASVATTLSDVTTASYGFFTAPATQATAFTLGSLYHYGATQGTFGVSSTVTNQYGFSVASSLTGATNNYGFYGNIASGTGRYNFYANGTADNFFSGNVGIGVAPTVKLDVNGDVKLGPTVTTGQGTTTGDAAIELGGNRTGSGAAYLDMHSTASSDYESRILRNSGADGGLQIFNTGLGDLHLYQVNAAPIAFYTTSLERMRITSAGDVGIGTSSPGTKLQVVNSGSTDTRISVGNGNAGFQIGVEATGACLLANFVAQPIYFTTNSVERMRIGTAGQLGIAGANYGTSGQVLTSGGASAAPSWATPSGGVTSLTTSSGLSTNTSATGAVSITNTGVTSAVAGTGVAVSSGTGAVTVSIGQAVATSSNVQFNSLGVGTAGSATAGEIRATNNITAYYTSDIKFKENIQPIKCASEIIRLIGADYFDWTDDYIAEHGGEDGYFIQKADFGVVAQKVQKVFPKAVRIKPDGTLAVDYEKLGVLAFPAIAEMLDRLDDLELRIKA